MNSQDTEHKNQGKVHLVINNKTLEAEVINTVNDFVAYDNFDFNNGHFIYKNKEYTIKKIGNYAFEQSPHCKFVNCTVTFPATITEIGDYAFLNQGRKSDDEPYAISDIKFNTVMGRVYEWYGIERIGKSAFESCTDLGTSLYYGQTKNGHASVHFPETLKFIDNFAFWGSNVNWYYFDFTKHSKNIIQLGWLAKYTCPSNKNGAYYIQKPLIEQYKNDKFWNCVKDKIYCW